MWAAISRLACGTALPIQRRRLPNSSGWPGGLAVARVGTPCPDFSISRWPNKRPTPAAAVNRPNASRTRRHRADAVCAAGALGTDRETRRGNRGARWGLATRSRRAPPIFSTGWASEAAPSTTPESGACRASWTAAESSPQKSSALGGAVKVDAAWVGESAAGPKGTRSWRGPIQSRGKRTTLVSASVGSLPSPEWGPPVCTDLQTFSPWPRLDDVLQGRYYTC